MWITSIFPKNPKPILKHFLRIGHFMEMYLDYLDGRDHVRNHLAVESLSGSCSLGENHADANCGLLAIACCVF